MINHCFIFLHICCMLYAASGNEGNEDATFWRINGERKLKTILNKMNNIEGLKAKNIILFIGDGMGISTITAGRIFKGQLEGKTGEEETFNFEEFPNVGLAKTYNVDKQVPDSAGTATAMFTGVKTKYGTVGMDNTTVITNSMQGKLTSIMDWAQSVGKKTGFVTTTRITHATPACLYANVYSRSWECDSLIPIQSKNIYKDIARQLVEDFPGKKLNVILGGGRIYFGDEDRNEIEVIKFNGAAEEICRRNDKRNLAEEWLHLGNNTRRKLVRNRRELMTIDSKDVDELMGLFTNNHLSYSIVRPKEKEPTLAEMTQKAIEILKQNNTKGFLLVIEGGKIDFAHHQNHARAALIEVVEFEKSIQVAINQTDQLDTLLLVTADHSHGITINGYPNRGNDILGIVNDNNLTTYETLSYTNGPGYSFHKKNVTQINDTNIWIDPSQINIAVRKYPTYKYMAGRPRNDDSHSGEDVPVYAIGPGSSLIRGVFEQNYIAYVISYAGCMGPAHHLNPSCNQNRQQIKSNSKDLKLSNICIGFLITLLLYSFV